MLIGTVTSSGGQIEKVDQGFWVGSGFGHAYCSDYPGTAKPNTRSAQYFCMEVLYSIVLIGISKLYCGSARGRGASFARPNPFGLARAKPVA